MLKLLPANFVAGAGSRAHPLGLAINPPNASSGVQPIIAGEVNTVYVQNEKMRRAWYVLRREGYTDASGTLREGDIAALDRRGRHPDAARLRQREQHPRPR